MLPLASAGFHVIAPDMRGYGRTTGWDDSYDGDVFLFRHTNLVRDALGLVSAFGYRSAAAVGRDAGSPVAAYCALIRPDVFRAVAMMTSPFAGPPALPFNTVEGATQAGEAPATGRSINDDLAKLLPPRKHYQVYYTTREANNNMLNAPQGLHAFLRAYYHYKSADWKGNEPFRLKSLTAEELAKMPHYYIMDFDKGMAETVASVMQRLRHANGFRIANWRSIPRNMQGQDFRAAFRVIGAKALGSPRTCKHTQDVRSMCPHYSSVARATGASSRTLALSSGCKVPPARRCAAPI
jgi:pimeloyl-ACP methyl ester carboxylesterase